MKIDEDDIHRAAWLLQAALIDDDWATVDRILAGQTKRDDVELLTRSMIACLNSIFRETNKSVLAGNLSQLITWKRKKR